MQGDIKTAMNLGVFAMGAVTALTVQNTQEVSDIVPIEAALLKAQIEKVLDDIIPDAVKIGMLPSGDCVTTVAEIIRKYGLKNVVTDPVIRTSSGYDSSTDLSELAHNYSYYLFPLCDIVTPNIPESDFFLNMLGEETDCTPSAVGMKLLSRWKCDAVLLKGGHSSGSESVDFLLKRSLTDDIYCREYKAPRLNSRNTHGTGCALSTAIACGLAKGLAIEDAVDVAKKFISSAIAGSCGTSLGKGTGPLDFFSTYSDDFCVRHLK